MTETKTKTADGFQEIAEKGIAQTKANFDKARAANEEGTDLLKNSWRPPPKAPQLPPQSSSKLRALIPTPPLTTRTKCWR